MYYIFYASEWNITQTAMYKKDLVCEIILEGKEENNKWFQIVNLGLVNNKYRTFSRVFENKKEAEESMRKFFGQYIKL